MSRLLTLITIILGLSIFLLSLRVLTNSLEGALGNKLSYLLSRVTTSIPMGIVTGSLATAVVQSSSVVAVTMVALVHARVLNLYQAFGIILGANIGTTLTAQIMSFDLSDSALPIMICGLFLLTWTKKMKSYGTVLIGFGGIFYGLNLIQLSLAPVISHQFIADLLITLGDNLYLGLGVGSVLTAIVQSSSAVTGLVITLAKEEAITLFGAVAVALGSNIGTVVTTLISSVGFTKEAKATAYADLIFNVLGVVLIIPFFSVFVNLTAETSPSLARQIANAHTLFNIVTALMAIPFVRLLTNISMRWSGLKN